MAITLTPIQTQISHELYESRNGLFFFLVNQLGDHLYEPGYVVMLSTAALSIK